MGETIEPWQLYKIRFIPCYALFYEFPEIRDVNDARFPRVVLTKECSLGEIGSGSLDRRRLGGELETISSNRGRSGEALSAGSGISI